MKHPLRFRYLSLLLLLLLIPVLLSSCGASRAPKKAAKDLLDACIACDEDVYAAVMGKDSVSLTDPEMFILRRMTYRLTDVSFYDDTHASVTAEIRMYDMMALLNLAFEYTCASAEQEKEFDPNMFMLDRLNTGSAEIGGFRAKIPLVLSEDGTWTLNTAAEREDLRDALSGGAYSWQQLYTTYYLGGLPE